MAPSTVAPPLSAPHPSRAVRSRGTHPGTGGGSAAARPTCLALCLARKRCSKDMRDSKLPPRPLDKSWNCSMNTPLRDWLLPLSYANSQHLFIRRENSPPFYLTCGDSAGPEIQAKGPHRWRERRESPQRGPMGLEEKRCPPGRSCPGADLRTSKRGLSLCCCFLLRICLL